MSHKPNPRVIGVFVLASLVLLIAMIFYFASSRLFSQNARYILFFDQSVNGLTIGSPVKFRGVPVGTVEQIMIRAEGQSERSNSIPVVISIDQSRLEKDLGLSADVFSRERMERAIQRGLVAQLNLESFVTGQLFVDFSYEPGKREQVISEMSQVGDMLVIPTLGSSLDQITSDVAEIIAQVGQVDLALMAKNLNAVLENTATVMAGIDSAEVSRSLIQAADEFSTFMTSPELKASMASIRLAIDELRATVKTYRLDGGPLVAQLEQFSATLTSIQELSKDSARLIATDSPFIYEITHTLRELTRAAESMRALTDYLERNPGALITGRPSDK